MKKVFLNEMDQEKRDELIKKNSKLMNQLQEYLYESQMDWQLDAFECIISKEGQNAIEYHDHYSSFFYTLKDWRKFYCNIDKDYLSSDVLNIYNEINDGIEKLDGLDPYSDEYYDLDEQLEEKTKIILKDIEEYLHTYENYPTEDDAIQYADEMEQLEGYYIEEQEDGSSDNVIRKDIAFTECYI